MVVRQLKKIKGLSSILLYTKEILDAYIPVRNNDPKVINLLANDICNSKCTMCNIWEQKFDFEISPSQLVNILKDRLFKKVRAIGITGGEPTLREDLPDLYQACCDAIPSLQSMSIITNAIKAQDVIGQIIQINEILKKEKKYFSVMISLDGYGKVHDDHRGRPGNFDSVVEVLNYVRNKTDIPISIGCTITKSNVYHADELFDWMLENKIEGRFRVGEFISRLYNDDRLDEIRNFDEEEAYHCATFFHRLKSHEKHPKYKRTYDSIISILSGGQRTIGCPYQENGVVLSSKGEVLYCAPKSKILGSALEYSANEIYQENLTERTRIKNEHCDTCIHDYHADATKNEYGKILNIFKWKIINKLQFSNITYSFLKAEGKKGNDPAIKSIFITGWYGTETVGDKAILGGIVEYYKQQFRDKFKLSISSIYPLVTRKTIEELGILAEVIPYYSRKYIETAASYDVTVMGGGPLMEMNALAIPLNAFRIAKRHKKERVIFGCGIGPLYNQYFIKKVKKILRLATSIKLRDTASANIAKEFSPNQSIEMIGDPAKAYLQEKFIKNNVENKKPILACFLREWSHEYARNKSKNEYLEMRKNFEEKLADSIKKFCSEFDLIPHFYSMHTFHIGGDDRIFYRRFLKKYFNKFDHYLELKPSNIPMIVNAMQASSYNLCMRFHSVLFAHTLDTNFIAIDYTNGGKIKGYLSDHEKLSNMVAIEEYSVNSILEIASA